MDLEVIISEYLNKGVELRDILGFTTYSHINYNSSLNH